MYKILSVELKEREKRGHLFQVEKGFSQHIIKLYPPNLFYYICPSFSPLSFSCVLFYLRVYLLVRSFGGEKTRKKNEEKSATRDFFLPFSPFPVPYRKYHFSFSPISFLCFILLPSFHFGWPLDIILSLYFPKCLCCTYTVTLLYSSRFQIMDHHLKLLKFWDLRHLSF